MKIDSEMLSLLNRTQKCLLSKTIPKILSVFAAECSASSIDIKKGLIVLEKIGFIQNLEVSGNVFSLNWTKDIEITSNYLVDEKDFILVPFSEICKTDERKENEIVRQKNEIVNLKEKLKEAQRDLRSYERTGKPFKKNVADAIIDHGNGTKI
ncbi:hypothetical protein ACFLRW_07485 [Acidobacteriota bacterium]